MSGHRRVKDVAYEDDEYEEYDGDDYTEPGQERSAEDEENLRQGSITARSTLGQDFPASENEIKEAIWYYYYDLDQAVEYLRSGIAWEMKKHAAYIMAEKYAPKEPRKQKQASRFDEAAKAAQTKTQSDSTASVTIPRLKRQARCSQSFSAADFFKDAPWLNVPTERLSNMILQPIYPRGGLLGGSSEVGTGKPSKLAALAAARKKAQEEKKQAVVQDQQSGTGVGTQQATSLALLDRLTSKDKSECSILGVPTPPAAPNNTTRRTTPQQAQPRSYPRREKKGLDEPIPSAEQSASLSSSGMVQESVDTKTEAVKAPPSIFARTMLGHQNQRQQHVTEDNLLPLLYPKHINSTNSPFAGPSPDDVVTSAQSKGAKSKSATAKKSPADTAAVANGLATVKLDDVTKPKGKNLDVVGEFKKSNAKDTANFVVIGHVDHGKSTLMGRLLYDLKVVNQRSVDKLRAEATTIGKSSFTLAWLMDSTSEERQRGVTVDIATNNFETEKTRFTILDAPGHRDFIPNMIAGVSQADFAVLVIDASANAFEAGLRGQTKEHALLARSMGIARIIVGVNKMDAAQWSNERFTEISQQMSAFFLAAGFQAKNIAFVPLAGLTGDNVVTKLPAGIAPWYTGRTLIEELDASEPSTRALTDPLRLTVGDVFRGGVQNPLSVSGRVDAGSLQTGDMVQAMPAGETATVKGIEVDGAPADWTVAGQIATLHLADIDPVHLRQGDIICSLNKPITNIKAFTAKILAFEHLTPGWVDVHKGRLHNPARVSQLLAVLDKSSGAVEKKKPRVIKPGAIARVRVELDKALPLEIEGRVVLRSEGATLAAGLIESVEA